MSTTTCHTGRCHCGAVAYEFTGEPILSVTCHCTDCSRISGAIGHAAFAVRRDTVTVTGEVTWYESPGDSGMKVRRGFCPRCGTRLFGEPDVAPDLMSISALSLDDISAFQPQMSIFVASAAPWTVGDGSRPAFDRMPPVPEA